MGLWSGMRALFGGASPAMTADQFTAVVAARMQDALPGERVEITGQLTIVTNGEWRRYLDNAYRAWLREAPDGRDELLDRFVLSCVESSRPIEDTPDGIVAIVKDRAWLAHIAAEAELAADKIPVHEVLNEHLIVVYAIDTPTNISYLSAERLQKLGIDGTDLRRHAVRNLRGVLPGIEIHGHGPLGMVTADGTYEASLLLFDDLRVRVAERCRGGVVVAVPTRDLLLFADEADADAVDKLQAMATQAVQDGTYVLTDRLFSWRVEGVVPR